MIDSDFIYKNWLVVGSGGGVFIFALMVDSGVLVVRFGFY
jgi:hypothetical protein